MEHHHTDKTASVTFAPDVKDDEDLTTVESFKRSHVLRHTSSDPTHSKFKDNVDPTSPLAEALRKHGTLQRMNASQYQKKINKGEITQEHEQYSLTYCMMLGIRNSVSNRNYKSSVGSMPGNAVTEVHCHQLQVSDFMHTVSLNFAPEGTAKTPPHRLGYPFKFKDYSPEIFRRLRHNFGISDANYMTSLCGDYNFIEFISNSKSGQFFFYSHDGSYLIKTQSKAESKFLRQILPRYFMYMMDHNNSLVVQFCGLHRVQVPHIRHNLHFVIMRSVYSNASSKKIHAVYDLKGSSQGRVAKPGEQVLKDLDLVQKNVKLKLGTQRADFLDQLRKDADFLKTLHIMDYSLLVGIHNTLASSVAKSIGKITGESSRALLGNSGHRVCRSEEAAHESPLIKNIAQQYATGGLDQPITKSSEASNTERRSEPTLSEYIGKETQQVTPGSAPTSPRKRISSKKAKSVSCIQEKTNSFGDPHGFNKIAPKFSEMVHPRENYSNISQEDKMFINDIHLGIGDIEEEEETPTSKFARMRAMDSNGQPLNEIYYFGIIDILQQFDTKKRTEFLFKIVQQLKFNFSSIAPNRYAKRFLKFATENSE